MKAAPKNPPARIVAHRVGVARATATKTATPTGASSGDPQGANAVAVMAPPHAAMAT